MSHPLDRRRFLRGAGVALALPFLPSLVGRSARALASDLAQRPRYLAVFTPCGAWLDDWVPKGPAGRSWSLPRSLTPLEPYRDRISVIRGLDATATASDLLGFHQREAASWLTCTPVTPTYDVSRLGNGWSTDQLLADARYADLPWPSLQLGPSVSHIAEDPLKPYASVYQTAVSWRGSVPMLGIPSHDALWRRLAGASDVLTEDQLRIERRRGASILDRVLVDLQAVRGKIGSTDATRLDEYLTGVRETERALAARGATTAVACTLPEPDAIAPRHYADDVDLMFRLAVQLLACDLTRVATLMTCDSFLSRVFTSLGQTSSHHEYTHHFGNPDWIRETQRCDLEFTWVLRRLLDALSAESDGEGGNLLDNTVVLYGSGMGDGSQHDWHDLPMLTVGSAGGRFKEGELIDATRRPLADLHLAMLQGLGLNVSSFGDAEAPLDALRT